MKSDRSIRILDVLDYLEKEKIAYKFHGDIKQDLCGFSSLSRYEVGTLAWCKSLEYVPDEIDKNSLSCVITTDILDSAFTNSIIVERPRQIFFKVVDNFWNEKYEWPRVGYGSYIAESVTIGYDVRIGHNCTIDGNITIGNKTVIHNNVVIIGNVKIGTDCEIFSGTVIGEEGLGFDRDEEGNNVFIKHHGGVSIGNRVHINANCEINRGVIDDTYIGDDVAISGGTTIGHNCFVGDRVTLTPACKLCGSVIVGDDAYISGATILNQVRIGKNAIVGLGSVVVSNVKDDGRVLGYPAKPALVRSVL